MKNLTLTITQLNNYINNIFNAEELLIGVSVFGEVSNLKISGGTCYFDLKEEGAQVSCIIFGTTSYNKLFVNGDKILVTGRLNYHIKYGKLSFIVSKFEPYGLGELYQKYIELKNKLDKEGVFDPSRKKAIPSFVKQIGVVTSETGAVIRDIIRVARRKNPIVDIKIYPVKVQGEGATETIIEGLKFLETTNVDVVIVARGGGSFEDFSPFNNEKIVRAVLECKKPIISAIGHETDFSLLDFVSDLRASTPSVASELAVYDYYSLVSGIDKVSYDLNKRMQLFIERKQNLLVDYHNKNETNFKNILKTNVQTIKNCYNDLQNVFDKYFANRKQKVDIISLNIEKSNPITFLKQGYGKLEKEGKPIKISDELNVNDSIDIFIQDAKLVATINEIKRTGG